MIRSYILLFISLSFYNCRKKNIYKTEYDKVYDLIKTRFIHKNNLDWNLIKGNIEDSITIATLKDKYRAIAYTINQLEDRHSFFLYPDDNEKNRKLTKEDLKISAKSKIIQNKIGYIRIDGFSSVGLDSLRTKYNIKLSEEIKRLDNFELSGWIFDLRHNKGGKLGNDVLVIHSLFDKPQDSVVGYSVKNESLIKHKIVEGSYYYGNKKECDSNIIEYNLKNKYTPIAVLINKNTASQGEYLANYLKNKDKVKLFGERTNGLTTDVEVFSFASGAIMGISTAYFSDENKRRIYFVTPDISCTNDEIEHEAVKWVESQSINK